MSEINIPINVPNVEIVSTEQDYNGDYIVLTKSIKNSVTCRFCSKPAKKLEGYDKAVILLYTTYQGKKVTVKMTPARYRCEHCENNTTEEISVKEEISNELIKIQRELLIKEHEPRGDLDTPRSQQVAALSDEAHFGSTIKPHEKFAMQPTGDDNRLSQQAANNPEAELRAESAPELTPSPSAKLQAQAVLAARPEITPKPIR